MIQVSTILAMNFGLFMTPADFTAMIARDFVKYQRLVKDIGAKID